MLQLCGLTRKINPHQSKNEFQLPGPAGGVGGEHPDCEAGSVDTLWILASYGVPESVSSQVSFAGVFRPVWDEV